ncbi:MAG: bile acid:sodium symporter [Sphingomonadales bacterium]|nr:bile acid:sodium symporter [Sphingomonadales bacterium]MBD3772765.1 bile acid:sodium symporter [Paracoccaceae bacterium]
MLRALFSRIDLMVRLLVLAILLASVLPATGEARGVAQMVSNAAVFILFLLNGMRLSRAEVLRGIGHWRFLLALALWSFCAMALGGMVLSHAAAGHLPALVALGFLYLGSLPSTVQSATAYTSLAGGSVANSVVAAALLNILGVFVTVPLFSLLGGGNEVQLGGAGLLKIVTILILPFTIGQLLQTRMAGWIGRHGSLVGWMDRISIATAVYVAFSGAVEEGIWTRLDPLSWAVLLSGIVAFLAFGFGGAWLVGGWLGLSRPERKSFLFAGAHKSTAMGAPLAMVLFAPHDAGLVLVPLLAYHLLQLVISAPLAKRLALKL